MTSPRQYFSDVHRAASNAAFNASVIRFRKLAVELEAALTAPSAGYSTELTTAAVRGALAALESALASKDDEECRNIAALTFFAFSRK